MNIRALFSLLPILCLCLLTTSSAKSDDRSLNSSPSSVTDTSTTSHHSKSRRLSSPTYYGKKELNRKLKGMNSGSKKNSQKKVERDDSSPLPSMRNEFRRLEIDIGAKNDDPNSNSHLLRFLKKKKKKSKTSTSKRVKKSKTKNVKSRKDDNDDLLE
jgi:uncharacterized protein YggU (UPF0235/DUF167 family)